MPLIRLDQVVLLRMIEESKQRTITSRVSLRFNKILTQLQEVVHRLKATSSIKLLRTLLILAIQIINQRMKTISPEPPQDPLNKKKPSSNNQPTNPSTTLKRNGNPKFNSMENRERQTMLEVRRDQCSSKMLKNFTRLRFPLITQ
jgi:hypothetical protein